MALRGFIVSVTLALFGAGCQTNTPASTEVECPDGCADGELCRVGKCFPAQCENARCGALEVCNNGACTAAACVGVSCPGDQLCAAGSCYPRKCGGDFCKSTEVCRDSKCVDARCVGVSCGADEICAAGRCYSPSCGGTACPSGSVCEAGACTSLACAGVVCPTGLKCVDGFCSSVCPQGQKWSGTGCEPVFGAQPPTLRVSPATASVPKGTTVTLKAEHVASDGTVTDVTSTATWTQGTCMLVTQGQVRAIGYESCTEPVLVESDGLHAGAVLTVGPPIMVGLQIFESSNPSSNLSWPVGDVRRLVARHVWSDATLSDATETGVLWTSSDPAVLSLVVDAQSAAVRNARLLKTGVSTVTVAWGSHTASAVVTGAVFSPLSITEVSPTAQYPGAAITVYGSGFDPNVAGNVVKIGTQPATVASVQPGSMVVLLPDAGFGALTLTTDAGTVTAASPILVGLPNVNYLSPPSPPGDVAQPIGTWLLDRALCIDTGIQAYWQGTRIVFRTNATLWFDLGAAQQPLGRVEVRALDMPNGCYGNSGAATLPPTAVNVAVSDDLSALDGGSGPFTGYFSTDNGPNCGGMRAFIVPTPGAAGRYVQVTLVPSTTQPTSIDEIFFSPN